MRRPILIAMLISVVMHVAIFLLADWLIGDRTAPSISSSLPVISIQSLQGESAEPIEWNVDHRKAIKIAGRRDNIADIEGTAVAARKHASALPSKKAAAPRDRLPASGLEHASARTAEVSASEDAAVSKPVTVTSNLQKHRIVMSGASRNEPPTFATSEISQKQETMLRRKFKEWTENFYRMSQTTESLSWRYKGQEYVAEFFHEAANNDMGIERVSIVVSTEENGQRLSTEMRMKRLAFSNYAQFINRWDSEVQIHDDELDGRFHSNTQINLTYGRKIKPQFHGQVTTSARRINVSERRGYVPRDKIFLGGLQTGVKAIRLPKHFLPFPDKSEVANDQVHRFDEDTRIRFYADGSYDWHTIGSDVAPQRVFVSGDTRFLVAGKNVKLHVKGTVNGKVLIYSPERIIIEGDLVYADDPLRTPDADDYLGLASDKYVDIAPVDITGRGDLVINAAIYAKRRFAVKGYRIRDDALLYIYGSLTAGTLSATEPRYATRIQFDQRLETVRPPRFPMTNRYTIESWDNHWTVEPAGIVY